VFETFTQKTDLCFLGGEISLLICQKYTLTRKLQHKELKGQQKVVPTVSHCYSYNWIILERRMQESKGQRHGTNKNNSCSLMSKTFSRDTTDHSSTSGSLYYC